MFFLLNLRKIITVKKIYFILLSLLLLFIGAYFYSDLLGLIISKYKKVQLSSTKLSSQIFEPIYFGLSLAMVPILIMLSWKFVTNKIMSLIFIIGSSLFGFLIELRNLNLSLLFQSNDFILGINLEEIDFSIYMFLGSLIGFILSILILKKTKPQS